jgi:hypothetical protein
VNASGGALAYGVIGQIFSRLSRRLGLRITPHDVRDAAATTWAIWAPDQIGISRDLLGHSDLRTTTKYYNRARGIEASRAYSQLIAGMRRRQRRHLAHTDLHTATKHCKSCKKNRGQRDLSPGDWEIAQKTEGDTPHAIMKRYCFLTVPSRIVLATSAIPSIAAQIELCI